MRFDFHLFLFQDAELHLGILRNLFSSYWTCVESIVMGNFFFQDVYTLPPHFLSPPPFCVHVSPFVIPTGQT